MTEEFNKWWDAQPHQSMFPLMERDSAWRGWKARQMFDAAICRSTNECLDPSANPDHFAQAIEAK